MRSSLIVVLLATATANAQPVDVTMDQAVQLYREHSPKLAAARAGVAVTEADVVEARIYPNPSVSVGVGGTVHGTATSGDSIAQAELDIPVLLGKRGARTRAAEHRVTAQTARVTADAAEGTREVRQRFIELLAAQERVTALAAAAEDAHRVREIVAGRAQAGAKSPYDLERTDLAVATVENRLADAETERHGAQDQLAEAIGIPSWHPHALGEFRPSAPPTGMTVELAHPELAAVRATEATAHAEEALAHAEARPTPNLVISGYQTNGPSGIGVTFGLELPLPLFDRNQGAVARARASAHAAVLEQSATQFELQSELDRAMHVFAARRDALAKFETNAVDRLPKIRTMAEDAYRSGQGGIVELLDALDAITETRLRQIELVEAVLDAELDVRAAAHGD
jgi:cobalt-zinc-cadmium efflux system outer membrane protein